MMNFFNILIVIFMGIMGIGSCVCIVGYMIITIAEKIYHKVKDGTPLIM